MEDQTSAQPWHHRTRNRAVNMWKWGGRQTDWPVMHEFVGGKENGYAYVNSNGSMDCYVCTPTGDEVARAGDWVAKKQSGELFVIPSKIYEAFFKPVGSVRKKTEWL